MIYRFIFYIAFFVFFNTFLLAQGEIDDQKVLYYRDEKSFSFSLNSNGADIGYQFGKRLNFTDKKLYGINLAFIKDPKEQKVQSFSGKFVFGKVNSVFSIRPTMGYQREVFSKYDKGGISIKYFFSYGPSLALLKPIYYKLTDRKEPNDYEKFNEKEIHDIFEIDRQASFFKGINETKFVPGAFGKFGFNFEYSKVETVIHAVEVGIAAEAFMWKFPIMAVESNKKQFFLILFVSYRLGKLVEKGKARNKKDGGLDLDGI